MDTTLVFRVANAPSLPAHSGPTGFVAEGNGPQMQTFVYSPGNALFDMNGEQVRIQLAVITYGATHILANGRGPIYGLRYRNQGHVVISKNGLGFDQNHLVPGPPV